MNARIPAEVFPPGEYLKDELEARNWTQVEFAEIIGKDTRLVYEVVNGRRAITPETAVILGEAFGTSPELWMNLESQYQLSKVRSKESSVSKRALLHSQFPVRDMVKRGWIEPTKNVDILEKQIFSYFGIEKIFEAPTFQHAAKKRAYSETSIQQIAWLCRARAIASSAPAQKYTAANLVKAIGELEGELEYVDGVRNVASILSKAGIRFVIVEALPKSEIDGACFWLDKSKPVVAMSLRFNRVDNFWHTLLHELDHVKHKEGVEQPVIDVNILGGELDEMPDIEIRANKAAAELLVPNDEMTGFIARVNPSFSESQIIGFARRMGVHPSIVIGQLQHRGLIHWSHFRKRLEKIREQVTSSTLTDGFGQTINDLINR